MTTDAEMEWAPESNLYNLFNDEDMEALDDLFDFSQYGPSLLAAWDLRDLEDGNHDEQIESSVQEPSQDSFDFPTNATAISQRDAQAETAFEPAPSFVANSLEHSAFVESGNGVSTLLPHSEGDRLTEPIINIEDFFEKPSTANEFFDFDNTFPRQETGTFRD